MLFFNLINNDNILYGNIILSLSIIIEIIKKYRLPTLVKFWKSDNGKKLYILINYYFILKNLKYI